MARNTTFSLENLRLLDFGKIGIAFNVETERCVKDCLDRPGEDKARVVRLEFKFAPSDEPGQAADCDKVKVECEITSGVPKRKTRVYEMIPKRDGRLLFNPDLPEEPGESTLYDAQERKEDQ